MQRAGEDPSPSAMLTRPSRLFRFCSFPALLAVLLVFAAFVAARRNLPDPDTWWHLVVGEEILTTGTWPTADHYSFTVSGKDWMAYEWLGEVLMALAGRAGGLPALALVLIALCAVFFLLLYYLAYLRSGEAKPAFLACALVVPLANAVFSLRPQLFGYIFLLLALICLERFRQGRQFAAWFLPVLFLLWVNTHGNFVFGLFVIGLYWLGGLVQFQARGGWKPERGRPSNAAGSFSSFCSAFWPSP